MSSKWEDISDWYDKKQGDEGDLWHRALIDPMLIRLVGSVEGKDMLDLGCGTAIFRGDLHGWEEG